MPHCRTIDIDDTGFDGGPDGGTVGRRALPESTDPYNRPARVQSVCGRENITDIVEMHLREESSFTHVNAIAEGTIFNCTTKSVCTRCGCRSRSYYGASFSTSTTEEEERAANEIEKKRNRRMHNVTSGKNMFIICADVDRREDYKG